MLNNLLPAVITTTILYIGTFVGSCYCIGVAHTTFIGLLLHVVLLSLFAGALWAFSEGDAHDRELAGQ